MPWRGVICLKNNKLFVSAVVLAGGSGLRMNLGITKQRITLLGESILHRTVRAFDECDEIDAIVVACRADELEWVKDQLKDISKPLKIVIGGKTRAESSYNAFVALPEESDFVAIHDGARCLITPENIKKVVRAAYLYGAASAGTTVTDTVKSMSDGFVDSTIQRDRLFLAHTPQIFSTELYSRAIKSISLDETYTDDNMLIERIGVKVCSVDTGKHNIKITTAEDLSYAEFILEGRSAVNEIRVGHGYDVHRLVEGRKLILGGVEIPFEKGLLGHSDADVLTHAIMDALLGACALGDIGRHFPDSAGEFKDISSLELLKRVTCLIYDRGYSIVNIDATLVMQRPKVSPYIDQMISNISEILDIEQGRINIKATTEEKLGFTGSGDGASAHAIATVKKG